MKYLLTFLHILSLYQSSLNFEISRKFCFKNEHCETGFCLKQSTITGINCKYGSCACPKDKYYDRGKCLQSKCFIF